MRPSDDGHALWAVTRSGATWLWGVLEGIPGVAKAAWRPAPGAPTWAGAAADAPPGRKPSSVDVGASSFVSDADGSNRALAQARVDIARVYPDSSTPTDESPDHVGFTLRVCAFTQPIKDGFSVDGAPLGEFVHGAGGGASAPGHHRRGDEPPFRVRRDGRVARGQRRREGRPTLGAGARAQLAPGDVGSRLVASSVAGDVGRQRRPRRDGGSVPGDGQKVRGFGHGVEPKW